jgi:hypothetical protein
MSKKPPEPKPDAPWTQDGKRFVASLQKTADSNSYKDFFDSDNLTEAKTQAVNAAKRDGLKVLVFDRQNQEVSFRLDPNAPEEIPKGKKTK